ncbi:MAG TPA: NAD(P)-dependent oxidoreductase [Ktedonobacteraceae bacterium]
MKILLTGAFGNIGFNILQELLRQNHEVRCFDLRTPATEKKAQTLAGKIEIVWGDIRQPTELVQAVEGQETIIHLAFIIPPAVDKDPKGAYTINVGGTSNLLEAAKSQATPPRFFFASTFDVFGYTQDKEPPRKVSDPLQATDDYTSHKIACEELVRNSGLEWAIFRFCDVPPLPPQKVPSPQPIMFAIPLDNRFEMIHSSDIALAVANGMHSPIWGKIWLIGGGPRCQIRYRDYLETMMEALGIGKLPEAAFTTQPYCTDWLDSSESQALLQYQRHSFEDIMREMTQAADPGPVVHLLMPVIRPFVRWFILRMSPYYNKLKTPSIGANANN